MANGLNKELGGDASYRNVFWVRNSCGTPIATADGRKVLNIRKAVDKTFAWMERKCPQLLNWRPLAIEYAAQIPRAVAQALCGLGIFFETYLGKAGTLGTPMRDLSPKIVRDPVQYLLRANRAPDTFKEVCKTEAAVNAVVDFLDWVLLNYFSIEDDVADPVIQAEYRNPLSTVESGGKGNRRKTVRDAMPYLWLERLRMILVQGEHFRNWTWAQQAQQHAGRGDSADWFEVDEDIVDKADPDCVWRKRTTGARHSGKQRTFTEIWSPVRWVALLAKLTTALRNFQVRMLDSGESDEWRFEIQRWAAHSSPWVLNDLKQQNAKLAKHVHQVALASRGTGCARVEGWSNGVLRRVTEYSRDGLAYGTVVYASTNKTADANKEGAAKGFDLPLPMEPCPVIVGSDGKLTRYDFEDKKAEYLWLVSLSRNIHFWLAKLRDWQARYNPIDRRVKWKELDGSGLIYAKSDEQFAMYRDACFLFREPAVRTGKEHQPSWPLSSGVLENAWWSLCKELQDRFAAEGKLQNGEMIRLVEDSNGRQTANRACVYDLHAIRVSLVTAWIVDGEIDPDVAILLTGHSRLVMLLYYNARTIRSAQEAVAQGQKRIDEKKAQRELDHIRNASIEDLLKDTAYNNAESFIQALGGYDSASTRRLAGWMPMPEGLCPVGGNTVRVAENTAIGGCFNGGPWMAGVKAGLHGPVEGGDHNCPNCRWLVTTPAYLSGLIAKFNVTSYLMKQALDKTRAQGEQVHQLQSELYDAGDRKASDTVQADLLRRVEEAEKMAERYSAEYTILATTALNTKRLVDRILEVIRNRTDAERSEALVLSGGEEELQVILEQTNSELLQLHLLAESYAVYPEYDAGEAIWRRSQILDASLAKDGLPPLFMQLSREDQVRAGNEFMHSIGRRLNPEVPGAGVLEGIKAIESGEKLGRLLGLNKSGMEKLLKESAAAQSKKVIRLVLARSGDSGTKLIGQLEPSNA